MEIKIIKSPIKYASYTLEVDLFGKLKTKYYI